MTNIAEGGKNQSAEEKLIEQHRKAMELGFSELRVIYRAGEAKFIFLTEEIKL